MISWIDEEETLLAAGDHLTCASIAVVCGDSDGNHDWKEILFRLGFTWPVHIPTFLANVTQGSLTLASSAANAQCGDIADHKVRGSRLDRVTPVSITRCGNSVAGHLRLRWGSRTDSTTNGSVALSCPLLSLRLGDEHRLLHGSVSQREARETCIVSHRSNLKTREHCFSS